MNRLHALLALLLLTLVPGTGLAQSPADGGFAPIQGGQPLQPEPGKVEVVEVFAYTCGHCAHFQPVLDTWARSAPANVRLRYLPVVFSYQDNYARAFFAAQTMGVLERFHPAVFEAIHRQHTLPGRGASLDEMAAFAATLGIDAIRFRQEMESAATDAKLLSARDFVVRSGIEGTPTLVVDGRYRVFGRSFEDTLRVAGELAARSNGGG